MNKMSPKVDGYVRKNKQWREELQKLRTILLESELTEDVKWRTPCYTFQNSNIAILGSFKGYCALSFFKGALLKDAKGILVTPGENTQSARGVRFTLVQQIVEMEPTLKAYINEAIEVEKAGLKVSFKSISEFTLPEELQTKLDAVPALKAAFKALTPGRQRAYIMHISAAKQSKTRESRVRKCTPRILQGKGLDDE